MLAESFRVNGRAVSDEFSGRPPRPRREAFGVPEARSRNVPRAFHEPLKEWHGRRREEIPRKTPTEPPGGLGFEADILRGVARSVSNVDDEATVSRKDPSPRGSAARTRATASPELGPR